MILKCAFEFLISSTSFSSDRNYHRVSQICLLSSYCLPEATKRALIHEQSLVFKDSTSVSIHQSESNVGAA